MRHLTIILFLFLELTGGVCLAQKQRQTKESYKSVLKRSSANQVDALLNEADANKTSDPNVALDKISDALAMSIARNDAFNEGRCYVLLGEVNEGIDEWKLAMENYDRAFRKLGEKYTSTREYSRSLQGLGAMHLALENYAESLKYFREALSLNLDQVWHNDRLLDLSEVYYRLGNYEEALAVLSQITPVQQSNSGLDTRVQNQRAKIQTRTRKPGSLNIYENSTNALKQGRRSDAAEEKSLKDAKEEITSALREQERYNDEIGVRQQAIDYNLKNNNIAEVTNDKVEIGKTLAIKGENRAALKQLEEAAHIADTLDDPKAQALAYLALAESYEQNGRPTQALITYHRYSGAVNRDKERNTARTTEKSELIKKQNDIESLTSNVSIGQREDTIERQTVFRQRLIIFGLLLIILIIGTTSFFIYKSARASRLANQLLALKSLRSQMNPHFIFNALNSVNQFIARQDERTANKFLSEFSQLMRLVLENSQEDFIPLQKEHEILALYLKLEHYRFRDKFDYTIDLDENINTENIEVPPMLIQPYLENAIWHGLRYKEGKGHLHLGFTQNGDTLSVEIHDDGIGRQQSAALKTAHQKKHNSTALKNIRERLAIINQVYHVNFRVSVEDAREGTGTSVKIEVPLHNRIPA